MKNKVTFLAIFLIVFGLTVKRLVYTAEMGSKEKEKATRNILPILVPNDTVEHLDILDIDPLSGKTFAELIHTQQARGDTFILARVVSASGSVYYFDAHTFNRDLLIQLHTKYLHNSCRLLQCEISEEHRKSCALSQYLRNPLHHTYPIDSNPESREAYRIINEVRVPMTIESEIIRSNADIQYFELINNKFIYLWSNEELFLKPYDSKKAFRLALFYANQSDDLPLRAVGQWKLGIYYQFGKGVAKNTETSLEYYKKVIANQEAIPDIKTLAHFSLGKLYEDSLDYAKAFHHFQKIAYETHIQGLQAEVLYHIGFLLAEGGHGIKKNPPEALQALNKSLQMFNQMGELCETTAREKKQIIELIQELENEINAEQKR